MNLLSDIALRSTEVFARQIYWRISPLRSFLGRRKFNRRVRGPRTVDMDLLFAGIRSLLKLDSSNLMIHSSIEGLSLVNDGGNLSRVEGSGRVASRLVARFKEEVGPRGTIAMPTHPGHDGDREFFIDKSDTCFTYNVLRTPSKVGLLSEVFRRSDGVQRSLHPLSSLACWGTGTADLLSGNLGDGEPLPHGKSSGYYRFCQQNGTVLSINLPLLKALTIVHCAEEVRDSDWPVPSFFYPRLFKLRSGGEDHPIRVRERRPIWVRNISLGQLRRDLLRQGILEEHVIAGIRVDLARSKKCFDYMMFRNATSTYPYFGI